VLGFRNGALEVQVAAPPVDGEANRELLETLSRALGVKRSAVSLVKGQTGRNKWIQLCGLTEGELLAKVSGEDSR
jgi:uncharacterized protein (TIGR00251 family)